MCPTKRSVLKKRNKKLDLIHLRIILLQLQEVNEELKRIQYGQSENTETSSELSDSEASEEN